MLNLTHDLSLLILPRDEHPRQQGEYHLTLALDDKDPNLANNLHKTFPVYQGRHKYLDPKQTEVIDAWMFILILSRDEHKRQ